METEEKVILQNPELQEKFKQERIIEIDTGLHIPEHFVAHMPIGGTDYAIMGEVFEPDFIQKEIANHIGTDPVETRERLGAIIFPIHYFNRIKNAVFHSQHQETLTPSHTPPQSFNIFEQAKLNLIDPCSYKLLSGRPDELKNYRKHKISAVLDEYLKKALKSTTANTRRKLYRAFWDSQEGKTHLISRIYQKQVKDLGATRFMPFVPVIQHFSTIDNFPDQEAFLRQTENINSLAYHIYPDEAVFNIELELSSLKSDYVTNMTCRMLQEAQNKIVCIKLLKIKEFFSPRFGKYATDNLFKVLKVLKELKDSGKIVGMTSGGGFGYNLLGICLNFYTDTVSNYPYEFIPPGKSDKKRALLHPVTHSLEPIEGVKSHLNSNGSLFVDNSIAKKYNDKSLDAFTKDEWSKDCRKMGLITHQQILAGRVHSILNGDKNALFLETMSSQFSKLAPIIRQLTR